MGKWYVIGFDMSAMKEEVYGEAIVDIVKPETLVSEPVIIKVRHSQQLHGRSTPIHPTIIFHL